MNPAHTHQIARAYFDAWSTRQGPDALKEYMAEDFTFRAGDLTIEGRDQFLSFGGWPEHAETNIVAEAYSDDTAIQIYEATNGNTSVRIADHLTIRDGRIVSSDTICDASSFEAFMAAN